MRTSAPEKPCAQFWVLTALLVAVFFTGGSSRADVQSLIVLRPLAILVCGYGLLTITRAHLTRYRWLFGFIFSWIGLCIAHLVPLPPALWQALPQRDLIVAIDTAAKLAQLWRPLSLAPSDTMNALFSLSVPLATALLAAQLGDRDRGRLLIVLISLGLVSATLGFAQAINPNNSLLFFYALANENISTGLFANRNHHALLLVMCLPMIAAAVARLGPRQQTPLVYGIALAAAVLLIPLILVSGSRAGVVLSIPAIAMAAGIVGWRTFCGDRTTSPRRGRIMAAVGATLVVSIVVGAVAFSRAESITRLADLRLADELRFFIWEPTLGLARDYFPLGSGIGTFVPVYQQHEATAALNLLYINHAHNEFLELAMTGGVPAIAILVAAVAKWLSLVVGMAKSPAAHDARAPLLRAGLSILLLLFLASLVDYPGRVPAMMCVAVIAAVWGRGDERRPPAALS